MIPASHGRALRYIRMRLEGFSHPWAVTGSLGFALQGFLITPNDVDLQTTGAGAYEMARFLALKEVSPVSFKESENTRSDFGTFTLEGLEVEILGDVEHRNENGTWNAPPDLSNLVKWVKYDELQIPVLPLNYEADAYERMGRKARADSLRKWLEENG